MNTRKAFSFFVLLAAINAVHAGDVVKSLIQPATESWSDVTSSIGIDGSQYTISSKAGELIYNETGAPGNTGFQAFKLNGNVVYDQVPYFVINTGSGIKWTNIQQPTLYHGTYTSFGHYRFFNFRPYAFHDYSAARGQVRYHVFSDKIMEEDFISYNGSNYSDVQDAWMEYPIDFVTYQIFSGSELTPVQGSPSINTGAIMIERPNGTLLAFAFPASEKNGQVDFSVEGNTIKVKHHGVMGTNELGIDNQSQIISWGRRLFGAESFSGEFDKVKQEIWLELNPLPVSAFSVQTISPNQDLYTQQVSYKGYDPINGIYTMLTDGVPWGAAVKDVPNKYAGISLTINSNEARSIYVRHENNNPDGAARLQDENGITLPVQVGITRSLGGDGVPDWTGAFANKDPFTTWNAANGFSRSEFPVVVEANESLTFRSLHMTHKWGSLQFAATGSVVSHEPIYTSNIGVWNSVDLLAEKGITGDFRSYSSQAMQWAWGIEEPGNEEQWASALEWGVGEIIHRDKVLTNSYAEIPSGALFKQVGEYSVDQGAIDMEYKMQAFPDNYENRLLLEVTFKANQDVQLGGDERLSLWHNKGNHVLFYNAFWGSTNSGELTPEFIAFSPGLDDQSSTIQTRVLEGEFPSFALTDKRWTFDPGTQYPTDGTFANVEANTFLKVVEANGKVNGTDVRQIPLALRAWKESPGGYFYNSAGEQEAHRNYVRFDLVLEQENTYLKAGDEVRFAMVLMPYGGKVSDNEINSANDAYHNYGKTEIVAVDDGEQLESQFKWVKRIRSTTGNSARFSVKGGQHVMSVMVEGFSAYKAPEVYKMVNGTRQLINYSVNGNDGVTSFIDQNGLVGFVFALPMTQGQVETFEIEQSDLYGSVGQGSAKLLVHGQTYQIAAGHSDLFLTGTAQMSESSGNVEQSQATQSGDQKWIAYETGGDSYRLVNLHSGLDLSVAQGDQNNGANVGLSAYVASDFQKWTVGSGSNGRMYFENVGSGLALDVAGISLDPGANVHQWTYGGGANQEWLLAKALPIDVNQDYLIRSRNSGLCVSVDGSFTENGSNIVQQTCANQPNQIWQFSMDQSGHAKVHNSTSDLLVETSGFSTESGANLQLWQDVGHDFQKWKILGVEGIQFFKVENVGSQLVMDVEGISLAPSANIHQWAFGGGLNQQWEFEPLSLVTDVPDHAKTRLAFYPNPAGDLLHVSTTRMDMNEFKITDLQGKVVLVSNGVSTNGITSIDIANLQPGIYFIRADEQGAKFVKR